MDPRIAPAATALALILAVPSGPLAAQVPPRDAPPLDVPLVADAPVVDGVLADPVWSGALVVDDFVARLPVDGAVPSVRTEVRLLHTPRALYVGLRAFDPQPDRIRLTTMRRDDFAVTEGDQFVIAIDSFHDGRNGYWFSTNPLGVRVDAQFADEGDRFEDNWNGVWEAAARVDEEGWTAELEIPWSTLRFREGPEVVMGINLFRRIPHTNEQIFAPAIPLLYAQGTPNVSAARAYRFGEIAGGARLDLRPFAVATRERRGEGGDGDGGEDLDGGLFLRLPVSDAVTLAATYRADFSEVEADESQLNLTRFPIFLPEKRDFFLEGSGLFTFGAPGEAELFFSRTIGFVDDAGGRATTVPVDWGAKATGRLGPVEFGALSAATGDAPGAPGDRFDVARGRFTLGGRSYLGGFWSRRAGGAPAAHTTAGVDASHFFPGEVRLQTFAARDRLGDADADAWFAALSRGGERAAFTLSALALDAGFAPAVGLVARPGTLRLEASGALPWIPAERSRVRRYAPSLAWIRYDDHPGTGFDERSTLAFEVDTKGDQVLRGELVRQSERLVRPFAIYRDVEVAAGSYARWEAAVVAASNPARPLSGRLELRGGDLYGGHHRFVSAGLGWRPSRFLSVAPDLLVDRVELPAASFTAWVGRLRVGLTVNPRLRFDLLGQSESETRATGAGLRARYDFREGTELVLAWDSVELTDPRHAPGEPERRREDRGALRFSYLARF